MMSGKQLTMNGITLSGAEPITPRTRAFFEMRNYLIQQENGYVKLSSIPGRMAGYSALEAADFLEKKSKEDALVQAKLMKTYKLSDLSQPNVEKGLRTAACNNKIADLRVFATLVKNIDAQDENPAKKFTALHLAVDKKHVEAIIVLKSFNAKSDIADAKGVTVMQKVKDLDLNEINSIFRDEIIIARRTP
jgi:hypothetical protein